jgi:predicted DCC family thiol-disulfide oxidoreductase YuxK
VIYDARCRFCIAGSARLASLARPGAVELVASTDPSLGARFPHLSPEMIRGALQLVGADGRVASGAAAIVAALETRTAWRLLTWVYRVPGARWVIDRAYAAVARRRYSIMGRADGACPGGSCGV